MKHLLFFLLVLPLSAVSQSAQTQPCDCPKAFGFVAETIKTNYAGWSDKVTAKNKAAFTQFTSQLRNKANGATEAQCYGLIARWTNELKDHHTGVYVPYTPDPYNEKDTAKIRAHFANWPKLPFNETSAKKYFDRNAKKLNPIEGIWQTADSSMVVAIVADKTPTRQFAGVILKGDGMYWQPGQVEMEWSAADSETYGGTYFMRNHSATIEYAKVKKGTLTISRRGSWTRIYPAQPVKSAESSNWNRDYAGKFELRSLDDSTMLLTLPDFDIENKKIIDSLLTTQKERLAKTPYFIIDVRNNGGGWDDAYAGIIDYLYTSPIADTNSNLLVTKENLRKWEGHYNDPDIPADSKAYIGQLLTDMKKVPLGQFLIRPNGQKTRPTVYPMPRRVGVIIGRDCGSSGEEFVMAARQSKKVTILGENTAGVLDYANIHEVAVPGSRFTLYYATSRTNRKQLIDNVGIAPDVRIPAEVTNWVDYTRKYLQQ